MESLGLRSSSSEEDIHDTRKRKRMLSNRESARRSRQRKQKHLDDLTVQVSRIAKENNQLFMTLNMTTELYRKVEAENCILRAQIMELSNRLQFLGNIEYDQIHMDNCSYDQFKSPFDYDDDDNMFMMINPWGGGSIYTNQPIMTSAPDMIIY